MPQRLLRYNVLARMEHELPAHSYVIYLLDDGEIRQSPLKWATPIKSDVVQFQFENIVPLLREMTLSLYHLQMMERKCHISIDTPLPED
jgi:hypothetical protein